LAVAGQRDFVLGNWIDRDWPRTLLHYDVVCQSGEFQEGKVQVVGPEGKPAPSQTVVLSKHPDGSIQRARVSFYAELPKGGKAVYRMVSAATVQQFPAKVHSTAAGQQIEVASDCAGVRLPAPCRKQYDPPVEASTVPAPILAFRLANGVWAGKGWLESSRPIASMSQEVMADGPLYKEYAYEVRYAPEGFYRARVSVEAELPLVHVAEEYDMGSATAGKDFFVLALNEGWRPDTAFWAADRLPPGKQVLVRERRIEHDTCVWRQPIDFAGDPGNPPQDREHSRIYPGGDWGPKAQWYSVFADADKKSPQVAILTEHSGAWRLPDQSLSSIWWTRSGQVLARMRTSINLNGCPQNPFSTAEIDPDLPQTLGRRMWALVLGPRPAGEIHTVKDGKQVVEPKLDYRQMDSFRSYQGFINLNDYKDWILTWPAQDLARPRMFATPASLQKLRANLDRCPGKERIKDTFLLTGDPTKAVAEGKLAVAALDSRLRGLDFFCTHYRQAQFDGETAFYADSALSCNRLPADLKEAIRAKVAAMCYMLTTADFCPRGAGMHMGNPNMAINRYMGMPLYAVIIQDHPLAKTWLDDAAVYTRWKASLNVTSAGGAFRENPGYATYGPSIFLSTAAIALRNAGYDLEKWEPLKDIARYFNDIDTPATRPRGMWRKDHLESLAGRKVRVLPGFGNGADVAGGQTRMLLASLTAKSDPAYAARMMGAFHEAGAFLGTEATAPCFWFLWAPEIAPQSPPRTDQMITGFGGVLRAHVGTPEETYVCLRQGYTQSHWNPDQGTFVLYARGACIAPPTGWGYSGTAGICHDSRICFGEPLADHEHGRVDTNIEDYGFLPSVGYLLGRQTFVKRWDKSGTLKKDFEWSRQALLIRSGDPRGPNYVVLRDTTQGDCPLPSWWYQWLVAKADKVRPAAAGVSAEMLDGVRCDIRFLEPADPRIAVKGTKVNGFSEDYSQISLSQPAGKGYLSVFYPYKAGEPLPERIEKLADGLARIVTSQSTDYVFASPDKPVRFKNDTVEIDACAGAVRVFKDKVLLVNASGRAGSVGYRNVVATGLGPFEQQVPLSPAGAQVVRAGRVPAKLTPPEKALAVDGSGRYDNARLSGEGLKGWVEVDGHKVTYVAAEGTGKIGYGDFSIKGEAPFVCVHEPGKVTITTEGRRRIFQMPIPENIVPPHLLPPFEGLPADFKYQCQVGGWINWPWSVDVKVDGISYQGGWYAGRMTVGIPEGKHAAEITPYNNPPVWKQNAFSRLLPR
jgi:hypothetical protein